MNDDTNCGNCVRCEEVAFEAARAAGSPISPLAWRMILCPTCGNKRCPKATHHDNECTGSNEPGQEGSNYR
jgi:hypothetical protein